MRTIASWACPPAPPIQKYFRGCCCFFPAQPLIFSPSVPACVLVRYEGRRNGSVCNQSILFVAGLIWWRATPLIFAAPRRAGGREKSACLDLGGRRDDDHRLRYLRVFAHCRMKPDRRCWVFSAAAVVAGWLLSSCCCLFPGSQDFTLANQRRIGLGADAVRAGFSVSGCGQSLCRYWVKPAAPAVM